MSVISSLPIRAPLVNAGFPVNLLTIVLLRLSLTSSPEPEGYLEPARTQTVFEWIGLDRLEGECVGQKNTGEADKLGQMYAFAIQADECTDAICDLFDGDVAVPFKGDLRKSIAGRELLMSRYYGGLGDILGVFSQLKIDHSEKHFIKVSVSAESNVSRLLFGVERVTNAMENQTDVDYCVCLDSDLPKDRFRIQTISIKNLND